MRFAKACQTSLITLCLGFVPVATVGAVTAMPSPLDLSEVPGVTAVRVAGTADRGARLQAELYATIAPELPDTFVNRRTVQTDDAGRFAATISIAPAYFEGTIITVIVRTTTGLVVGRGSIRINDPGAARPAHG